MKYFETEHAVYEKLLPELLVKHEDKYAVIKGERLLGVFNTHDEGYRAGLNAFGVVPFLLRHITKTPRVIRMYGVGMSQERAHS